MSNPVVSIGFPVYNGANSIRQALDSLLAQTFPDFELIISDNASTDETALICLEYASRDGRIKYIRQATNIGAFANFKFVLGLAVGEFFMWHAADDYRTKDCLEYYLSTIGDAGGTFTTFARVDRETGSRYIETVPILTTSQTKEESLRRFFANNCTSLCYGLYRRQVLLHCMPKDAFDWFDSFLILTVIRDYGFNSGITDPKYFAGYHSAYVPKPFHGRYIRSFTYFKKALGLALSSGPVAFLCHVKTLFVSANWNLRIWVSSWRAKVKGRAKVNHAHK